MLLRRSPASFATLTFPQRIGGPAAPSRMSRFYDDDATGLNGGKGCAVGS